MDGARKSDHCKTPKHTTKKQKITQLVIRNCSQRKDEDYFVTLEGNFNSSCIAICNDVERKTFFCSQEKTLHFFLPATETLGSVYVKNMENRSNIITFTQT